MTQIENAEGWWLYVAWRLSNWELAAQGEDQTPPQIFNLLVDRFRKYRRDPSWAEDCAEECSPFHCVPY